MPGERPPSSTAAGAFELPTRRARRRVLPLADQRPRALASSAALFILGPLELAEPCDQTIPAAEDGLPIEA